jgi:hypothetical protein
MLDMNYMNRSKDITTTSCIYLMQCTRRKKTLIQAHRNFGVAPRKVTKIIQTFQNNIVFSGAQPRQFV